MLPVLRWKLIEGQEGLSVLPQTVGNFRVFRLIGLEESVKSLVRLGLRGGPSRCRGAQPWLSHAGSWAVYSTCSRSYAPNTVAPWSGHRLETGPFQNPKSRLQPNTHWGKGGKPQIYEGIDLDLNDEDTLTFKE